MLFSKIPHRVTFFAFFVTHRGIKFPKKVTHRGIFCIVKLDKLGGIRQKQKIKLCFLFVSALICTNFG